DADVKSIASDLTYMVHVVDHHLECTVQLFRIGNTALPSRNHHPGIQDSPNNCTPSDEFFDLFIAEISVLVNMCPAVVVTCPNWSVEVVHGFPETVVAQVCCIKDDVQSLHLLKQFLPFRTHRSGGIGALGIATRTVVCGANSAQSVRVCTFKMIQCYDRICTLEAKNVTYWLLIRRR